jgi:HPt (histidine-containing phosphotransfer) domain-containing protein
MAICTSTLTPPIDLAALLDRFLGNRPIVDRLLRELEKQVPENLIDLKQSINSHDFKETLRLAHSLKGMAAALSASELARLAEELQHFNFDTEIEEARQCLTELSEQVQCVLDYIPQARLEIKSR